MKALYEKFEQLNSLILALEEKCKRLDTKIAEDYLETRHCIDKLYTDTVSSKASKKELEKIDAKHSNSFLYLCGIICGFIVIMLFNNNNSIVEVNEDDKVIQIQVENKENKEVNLNINHE